MPWNTFAIENLRYEKITHKYVLCFPVRNSQPSNMFALIATYMLSFTEALRFEVLVVSISHESLAVTMANGHCHDSIILLLFHVELIIGFGSV